MFRITKIFLLALGVSGAFSLVQAQEGKMKASESEMKAPDFQTMAISKYSFDDTVELLKGAIEEQNLMVIKEIDAQKMLRMVDVKTKGMKQVLFFHPRFMKRIMGINKHATIEPPLKIAVMEKADGKVMVKYIKPSYIFGRYNGLGEIGDEFDGLVAKIVESIQK